MYTLNEPTIRRIEAQDKIINDTVQYIVPLTHGDHIVGPAAYPSRKLPPIMEKQNFAKMMTGQDLQITTSITDEDVAVWEHKAKLEEARRFKEFAGRLFQPELGPAHKKRMNEVMPGWLEEQQKLIESYHDFKKRIEVLKLRGPQNEEDVIMLWRLGYPDDAKASVLGKNPEIAAYLSKEVLGAHVKAADGSEEEGPANAQFLRGVLNTNKRDMTGKVIMGTPQSIFPAQADNWARIAGKPAYNAAPYLPYPANAMNWSGAPIDLSGY